MREETWWWLVRPIDLKLLTSHSGERGDLTKRYLQKHTLELVLMHKNKFLPSQSVKDFFYLRYL